MRSTKRFTHFYKFYVIFQSTRFCSMFQFYTHFKQQKTYYFLPPDMHTYVCVSMGKNISRSSDVFRGYKMGILVRNANCYLFSLLELFLKSYLGRHKLWKLRFPSVKMAWISLLFSHTTLCLQTKNKNKNKKKTKKTACTSQLRKRWQIKTWFF